MSNIIDKIQLSGTNYDIQDSNATRVVEITQSEYDALPSSAKTSNTFFVITDAEVFNISGFVQTSAVTTSVTSTSTDAQIPTAKAVYNALGSGGGITSGDVQTMITQAVSGKTDTTAFTAHTSDTTIHPTQYVKKIVQNSDNGVIRFYDVWKESGYAFPIYNFSINGKMVLSKQNGTYPDVYNFNLVETSAITSAVTSASTDSEIPSAKAVNNKLGGLTLVKITQSAYDALTTKDSNTLYVING